jgi:hypothetical protein
MPRNGCSQRLSRIKKMLKEASEWIWRKN